jgi:hypothetical protein
VSKHLRAKRTPPTFESLGKTVKVLTLSNGKYNESFPNDSIMRIGSVLYNRNMGELVSVIPPDTLQPRTDVPSRWLSIDPLAHKFAAWSPYNFVMNNPVVMTDPDGCAPVDTRYYDEKGNLIHHSKDNLKNAVVIIDQGSAAKFKDYITKVKAQGCGNDDGQNAELRKKFGDALGNVYDEQSLIDLYKIKTKVDPSMVKSLDGKPIYAEHGANMIKGADGSWYADVKNNKTDNDPFSTTYNESTLKTPIAHSHHTSKGRLVKNIGLGRRINEIDNCDDGPSSKDNTQTKNENIVNHRFFNVVIENGNYYFYREKIPYTIGEKSVQTIKIPILK